MPTIGKTSLDEDDYKKELSKVVSETRTINVQVAGLDNVQFLRNEIAKLPDEKKVAISSVGDIDSSALEKGRKMAVDISTGVINASANISTLKKEVISVPVESLGAKFKNFFSGVIDPFSSVDKGLKQLAGGITNLLNPTALVIGAVGTVITLGKEAWDALTVSAEEYAGKTRLASEAAQEQLQKTQEQDQAAQGYMDRLHEIASAESLSNSSKQETAQLLELLQSQYGDLGAEIDETTGKCKNLLDVEDRLNKARGERLSRDSAKVADAKMDEAKAAYMKTKGQDWGTTEWGAADGFEQMKKSMSVDQMIKYMEALSKKGTRQYEIEGYAAVAAKLRESSAAGKKAAYQAHTGYVSQDEVNKGLVQKSREVTQANQHLEASQEQFKIRKADDEMNRLQDPNAKIANRQALIDADRARLEKEVPKKETDELEKKVADNSDTSDTGKLKLMEAKERLLQLESEQKKSDEKIYQWEQQIAQVRREHPEHIWEVAEASAKEQNNTRPFTGDKSERAARYKPQNEQKQQSLNPDTTVPEVKSGFSAQRPVRKEESDRRDKSKSQPESGHQEKMPGKEEGLPTNREKPRSPEMGPGLVDKEITQESRRPIPKEESERTSSPKFQSESGHQEKMPGKEEASPMNREKPRSPEMGPGLVDKEITQESQRPIPKEESERTSNPKFQSESEHQEKTSEKEEASPTNREKPRNLDTGKTIAEEKTEWEIQRLILSGEYEKADILKRQLEYKRQGKTLDAEQEKALKKQQETQNAMNLQKSMKDQGKSLLYGAMEQAGMGQEAAYAKALDDAEKTKGGKLTKEEADRTKQLTDLSLQLSATIPAQLGDLGIRTNDLTARGGFSSGAVMPEKDEVNRAIRSNTQQTAEALKGIQTWLDKLNNSIQEGNRN